MAEVVWLAVPTGGSEAVAIKQVVWGGLLSLCREKLTTLALCGLHEHPSSS